MFIEKLVGADAEAVAEISFAAGAPGFASFFVIFAIVNAAAEFGYVTEVGDAGPVVGEDARGVGVNLGKGQGAETRRFKGEGEAADAAEQVKVCKVATGHRRGIFCGCRCRGRWSSGDG